MQRFIWSRVNSTRNRLDYANRKTPRAHEHFLPAPVRSKNSNHVARHICTFAAHKLRRAITFIEINSGIVISVSFVLSFDFIQNWEFVSWTRTLILKIQQSQIRLRVLERVKEKKSQTEWAILLRQIFASFHPFSPQVGRHSFASQLQLVWFSEIQKKKNLNCIKPRRNLLNASLSENLFHVLLFIDPTHHRLMFM